MLRGLSDEPESPCNAKNHVSRQATQLTTHPTCPIKFTLGYHPFAIGGQWALGVVFFGTFYDFVPSLSRKNEEVNIKDEGIRKKKKLRKI